jgi:SAM-dependent methyltransferase
MTVKMTGNIDGYATDIPYLRDFKPMLAPAWLDHVALVAGVVPPARIDRFAWCDLGCGQGVTAAILAATHPTGVFHGLDAMPVHIDHARRLAKEVAIPNVHFHATDFAGAIDLELPQFDYIVAHGVYTWVDRENQRALLKFIDRRLKPGGVAYLGYNAMPGWGRDLPFQRLVGELGRSLPGDSAARFAAAADFAKALGELGVPSLAASFTIAELKNRPQEYASAYLVHEFMPAAWQPLYVTEVRAAMAAIGFEPVGSATLGENFDWMVLSEDARAMLATLEDRDTRELVRDFCLDQRFRCDVFARSIQQLDPPQRAERILATTFALARPAPAIHFSATTPRGPLSYDNPTTRTIVEALESGPRPLRDLIPESMQTEGRMQTEALDAVLILCAAGDLMPVEAAHGEVEKLNEVLCARVDGPGEIRWLALPCGTALEVDRGLMALLREGGEIDDSRFPGWRKFLASHGLSTSSR